LEEQRSGLAIHEYFVAAFFEVRHVDAGRVGREFGEFHFAELDMAKQRGGAVPVDDSPEFIADGDQSFEVFGDDTDENFDGYGEFGVGGLVGDEEIPVAVGDFAVFAGDDTGFDVGDDGGGFAPGSE
jgi:hypothetical protein